MCSANDAGGTGRRRARIHVDVVWQRQELRDLRLGRHQDRPDPQRHVRPDHDDVHLHADCLPCSLWSDGRFAAELFVSS